MSVMRRSHTDVASPPWRSKTIADAAQGIVIGQPVRMTNQHSGHASSPMNPRHAVHIYRAVDLQGVEDMALNGFPSTGGRMRDDYVTMLGPRMNIGTLLLQRFPKAGDDQLHIVNPPSKMTGLRPALGHRQTMVGSSGLPPWPGRSQRAMPKLSRPAEQGLAKQTVQALRLAWHAWPSTVWPAEAQGPASRARRRPRAPRHQARNLGPCVEGLLTTQLVRSSPLIHNLSRTGKECSCWLEGAGYSAPRTASSTSSQVCHA